jgi:hypothetical protein
MVVILDPVIRRKTFVILDLGKYHFAGAFRLKHEVKVSIDCFFLLAITNSVSKLKHNYVVGKLFLEELISMSLLIKINYGIQSGKNNSTLSIKVLPQSLMMHTGKQFVFQFLDQVKIPWVLYNESCYKLVISSSSAQPFEGRNHRPGCCAICKVFLFHKFTIANFIFCFPFFTSVIKQSLIASTAAKDSAGTVKKRNETLHVRPRIH